MVISPILLGLILLAVVALLALEGKIRSQRHENERIAAQVRDPTGAIDHLWVGLRQRRYYLHLPPGDGSGKRPLMIALHGGQGNGVKLAGISGFNELADREGFAVVYPDGVTQWNDGRDTTEHLPDDVRFIRKLVKRLIARSKIDPARVYAAGVSSGGMFSLKLACEASDIIAGFGAINAAFPVNYPRRCGSDAPVPLIMINGTLDTFIPWNGGNVRSGRMRGAGGRVISVPETVQFWARHNGCSERPTERQPVTSQRGDGTVARFLDFAGCRQGGSLRLIRIEGGGHTWPGSPLPLGPQVEQILGKTSYAIVASEEIWNFCRTKRLATPGVVVSA